MGSAFFWGAFGAGSLVIGAVAALVLPISMRVLGLIMALGCGVLISAVAFDLVEEAVDTSDDLGGVALGLAAGALAFYLGDAVIDRMGGEKRKSSTGEQADGSGPAIVLGAVLDGIPESIVLGLGLLGGTGVSLAFIFAVFLSNLPEGIAGTRGLVASGWTTRRVIELWLLVVVVSAMASLAGYAVFDSASDSTVAFVLAFAGGAVLTMLADTMAPEAFEHAGREVGLMTTAGFALAFALHMVE